MGYKCYKHKDRDAVAVINKQLPVCDSCATDASAYILNSGGMWGMSVRGKPIALLIPQDRINN